MIMCITYKIICLKHTLITFFIYLFLLSSLFLYSQKPLIAFEHLTLDDGLSNNFANDFYKDKMGFLWIASSNGLDKYDGYTIKNYYLKADLNTKVYFTRIKKIKADLDGNIWLAGENGLVCFNLMLEKITYVFDGSANKLHNFITIEFDSISNSLFGFANNKFFKYDLKTKQYKIFFTRPIQQKIHTIKRNYGYKIKQQ